MRYAIAGCGYVSRLHFQALSQIAGAEIVAAADLHADLRVSEAVYESAASGRAVEL